jgi:SAM-dependent methyltransferase
LIAGSENPAPAAAARNTGPVARHAAPGAIRRLSSFYRRRIACPVGPDALVLDIGSGDKPHWRADILVDRFPGAEYGAQRSDHPAARLARPLFDTDAADMPFADRVFDYAICSHVLEHVPDPGAVIDEMVRVAKAGYIEVPRVTSAKIIDFPSHLWWCDLVGDELIFTAKRSKQFDPDIERFVTEPTVHREILRVLDRNFDACVVRLSWSGSVRYRVIGEPDEALVNGIANGDPVHHRRFEAAVSSVLTAALTVPMAKRRHRPTYNQLVKPDLRLDVDRQMTPGVVVSGSEERVTAASA